MTIAQEWGCRINMKNIDHLTGLTSLSRLMTSRNGVNITSPRQNKTITCSLMMANHYHS